MDRRRRNDLHRLDVYRCALELYRRVGQMVAKELIVALDCVEIDQLAPIAEITAAQDLADRIAAMLTKLIRSAEDEHRRAP